MKGNMVEFLGLFRSTYDYDEFQGFELSKKMNMDFNRQMNSYFFPLDFFGRF